MSCQKESKENLLLLLAETYSKTRSKIPSVSLFKAKNLGDPHDRRAFIRAHCCRVDEQWLGEPPSSPQTDTDLKAEWWEAKDAVLGVSSANRK